MTTTTGTVLAEVGELTLTRKNRGFTIEGKAHLDVHDLNLPDHAAAATYALRVVNARGVYTGNVEDAGTEDKVFLYTTDYAAAIALLTVFIGLVAA